VSGAPALRIAIVGLGLIGGSLGMRIRELGLARVVGIDTDYTVTTRAQERGAADEAHVDLERVRGAEVIIVAVPPEQTVAVARQAAEHATEGAILTDVASVKAPIVMQLGGLERVRYVGGHPMFGSEGRGIDAASAALPEGHPYIFTPVASTPDDATNTMLTLARDLGMRPVLLTPDEHDRQAAEVSHLPYLLALLLNYSADPQAKEVAGPAFRDATRVAATPPDLMVEILRLNRVHVLAAVDRFSQRLAEMRDALARGHVTQAVRFR
jgi:prephenate dehydrogenase